MMTQLTKRNEYDGRKYCRKRGRLRSRAGSCLLISMMCLRILNRTPRCFAKIPSSLSQQGKRIRAQKFCFLQVKFTFVNKYK